MLIKERPRTPLARRLLGSLESDGISPRGAFALAACLLAAAAVGASLSAEGLLPSPGALGRALSDATARAVARLGPPPDRLTLDVAHIDFQRLASKRAEALATGVLLTSPEDFVPATVGFGGASFKAKIRLKGDWAEHMEGPKWSFRVKLSGDGALLGLREFSIHHPAHRAYLDEWHFHEALRREGILAPRYGFLAVTINGEDKGIYAIEEHFDERLLEGARRRSGPLLKFDESLLWEDIARRPTITSPNRTGLGSPDAARVAAFKLKRLARDPAAFAAAQAAHALLEGFRRRKLPASSVFDLEKLAGFYALADLFGAGHATTWHNLRFYYDPLSGRLEPVGFDGDPGSLSRPGRRWGADDWFFPVLAEDPAFFAAYVRAVERVIKEEYLLGLFAATDPEARKHLGVLRREFPFVRVRAGLYEDNRRSLENNLHPVRGMHAFLQRIEKNRVVLRIANIQKHPVEPLGLGPEASKTVPAADNVVLTRVPGPPVYAEVPFSGLPAGAAPGTPWDADTLAGLRVFYRTLGSERVRSVAVAPWPYPEAAHLMRVPLAARRSTVGSFPFLSESSDGRTILFRPGEWTVDKPLIVPPGRLLAAGPGTTITLTGRGMIFSRSALRFAGDETAPVRVLARDSGQGVFVMEADRTSLLSRVVFEGLSPPKDGPWEASGALTFYRSGADIERCRFVGLKGEDALNVVESTLTVSASSFEDSAGDALDADFSQADIVDTVFLRSGGDAIDASGSVIKIEHARIEGAGDKGLSVGEHSRLDANDLRIRSVRVAAAAKDLSLLRISGLVVERAAIGLAAFRKKASFGGAEIQASNIRFSEVAEPFLVEKGSALRLEGRPVAAEAERVRDRLYPPGDR